MNDAQIFQWIGITFFAMGMGMLTNPKFIKDMIKEFSQSTTLEFLGGLFCLAIALPLVTFHNLWNFNSSLIITLLGWLSLFKGLALLMFPSQIMPMYRGVLIKENKAFISYFVLGLGLILLYLGFFA